MVDSVDNNPLIISEELLKSMATPLEYTRFGPDIGRRMSDALAKEIDRQMLELFTQGYTVHKKLEI